MKTIMSLCVSVWIWHGVCAQERELPYGPVVVPLVLESALVDVMGWHPGDEIWFEVEYLTSPDGESVSYESAERLWWLGEMPVLFLGATGDELPREVINRGMAWVRLFDRGDAVHSEPLPIYPRHDRIRLDPNGDQMMSALNKMLPGVNASYLSQVANFLAGNLANLDVQGTSYSVSGYGQVIDSDGEWTGSAVNADGSIVIDGITDTITAGSGTIGFDDEDLVTNGQIGIGTTDPTEALTLSGGNFLQTVGVPKHMGAIFHLGSTYLTGAHGIYVLGDYAYVTAAIISVVEILDISDPTHPRHVGKIWDSPTTALASPRGIHVSGKYAYVASSYDDGLEILDVSDPSNPTHAGAITDNETTALDGAYGLFVSGKYAYVSSVDDNGVEIIDVSDPSNPTHVGAIFDDATTELYQPFSLHVVGNYAYVTSHAPGGIEILDISDPSNPTHVGSIIDDATTALEGARYIYVSGKFAYVTSFGENGVEILDISDPSHPTHVGAIRNSSQTALLQPCDIQVAGHYAYVASLQSDGVEVLDISDPTNPTHVAAIIDDAATALEGAKGLFVSGDYVYVTASHEHGVEVLNISGIDAPAASLGALSADRFHVTDDAQIGGSLFVGTGLNVGPGGVQSGGDVGVEGSLTLHGPPGSRLETNVEDGSETFLKLSEGSGFGFEFEYDGADDKFHLWSRKFAGSEAIRMTWMKNGRVGIGTTDPQGTLDVDGTIYQSGSLLHADYVFEPDYPLESIEKHAAAMWTQGHLPAVPKRRLNAHGREVLEVGTHRRGMLEELEIAHIYIEQLDKGVQELKTENEALQKQSHALKSLILEFIEEAKLNAESSQ